jgi:glycosyltransferase involved in cell wall biosynthesis
VGKPGYDFVDVRIVSPGGIHLGILGLPRIDLAAYFKSVRRWLPAEFVVGVPATIDGSIEYSVEAMDEHGNWHRLRKLAVQVATDGAKSPRNEGDIATSADGTSSRRTPHLPFYGHLDMPAGSHFGRTPIFGWLLHETQELRSLLATVDGLVFNTLEFGLTDESLAIKLPQYKTAGRARLKGEVDTLCTVTTPACLRVYAELVDGTVTLCFAQRISFKSIVHEPRTHPTPTLNSSAMTLADLPSGRPRRLLITAKTLQPDEATLRALDVACHLAATTRWTARLVVSEDGPLRDCFEAAGCPVQIVDPAEYFATQTEETKARALVSLGRQIWWRHLDAVAIFDRGTTWVERLAGQKKLPVLLDPADALLWSSPKPIFSFDPRAPISAPIRGRSIHGAGVIIHAADQLARKHHKSFDGRKIFLTDVRETTDEHLFLKDLRLQTVTHLAVSPPFQATAAVICPAFADHPHRALLSAAAAGVPIITTSSSPLSAVFGPNEAQYIQPGNPLALAHAIADTLANPSASERRTAAAARIVATGYAPEQQLARWQELLESIVGG